MSPFKQKSTRIFMMFLCLILWNLVLVSCGDDDGDDGLTLQSMSSPTLAPTQVDWISQTEARLVWHTQDGIKSYVVYDNTSDGLMIRAILDAIEGAETMEITLRDLDPQLSHAFHIVVR